jgi:hypothetical protein
VIVRELREGTSLSNFKNRAVRQDDSDGLRVTQEWLASQQLVISNRSRWLIVAIKSVPSR